MRDKQGRRYPSCLHWCLSPCPQLQFQGRWKRTWPCTGVAPRHLHAFRAHGSTAAVKHFQLGAVVDPVSEPWPQRSFHSCSPSRRGVPVEPPKPQETRDIQGPVSLPSCTPPPPGLTSTPRVSLPRKMSGPIVQPAGLVRRRQGRQRPDDTWSLISARHFHHPNPCPDTPSCGNTFRAAAVRPITRRRRGVVITLTERSRQLPVSRLLMFTKLCRIPYGRRPLAHAQSTRCAMSPLH